MLEACHTGGATLHGTGVHPTFIVERVAMTMAKAMSSVSHVRSVEAVDFSRAGSMWGGLGALGFGAELDSLGAESPVARGGDIYYGDLTGNVAHALYGADSSEVRSRHRCAASRPNGTRRSVRRPSRRALRPPCT